MSIEEKIDTLAYEIGSNTLAIRDLIAALGVQGRGGVAAAAAPKGDAPYVGSAADPAPADVKPADGPITRDSAKEIAKALNVKDAKKLKEVLTTLGAPNFAAVKDEQLAEFVKLAQAAL